MQAILKYIDANLKTDISAGELAAIAAYSPWHFYHVFSKEVGMPVAAYISKRRIDTALMEIAAGRKSASVAAEYGFDTYAGFYKAFVRMYGCSPRKYLALYGSYKPKQSGGMINMNEHEVRQLLTNWDVPQNLPLGDIHIIDRSAVSNNVWKLGNEYVLKCAARDMAFKNIRITKALAAQGFTAAQLVPTKTGEDYIDGEIITTLTHRLPGMPLPKEDRFGADRYNFGYKYGQAIAKLHIALKEVEADIMPNESDAYKQCIDWALPNVQKQNQQWNMGLADDFFENYITEFGKLYEKMPRQLIHRDANPSNILFHNGEVSGFIDFELSQRNMRMVDVCYCATGILCEWRGVDNIEEKWPLVLEGILKGYNSINPLTAEEKQAAFYVLCSIQMACVAYFANIEEFQELAKTNRGMLQYIAKCEELIKGMI